MTSDRRAESDARAAVGAGTDPRDRAPSWPEVCSDSSREELRATLAAVRTRVQDRLAELSAFDTDCPARLGEAIRYSLLDGGKRLRPALVLLACEACGGTPEEALPAACAVEAIHCYSLIHDDLPAMDDDDLRRGKPTNHKVFGEAFAILAGDGLLTLAFSILAHGMPRPERAIECVRLLADAAGVSGMVGGQAADIEAERSAAGTSAAADEGPAERLARLEAIHRRKTGALLTASLRMGAAAAGARPEQVAALTEYGRRVGLAFQIVDDLLDVQGDAAVVGKRVGKDASAGKLTFPTVLGIEPSRRKAELLIAEAIEGLSVFGERGRRLRGLARFVLERDR